MSEIENVSSSIAETLIKSLSSLEVESVTDKIEKLRKKQLNNSAFLNTDTLSKLRNGEYNISLKQYTSLTSYDAIMEAFYGNNSASPFKKYLNNLLETDDDKLSTAKSFLDKLKERGFSNKSSMKMYSALQKYSLATTLQNFNYVNTNV